MMNYKMQFTNEADKATIIENNIDKVLIEEQNIKEGNFLIFTDAKPLEVLLQENKEDIQSIKDGLADVYLAVYSIPGVE